MNRSLMKQCLDALEAANRAISAEHVELITEDAIEALRAELAKPEPKPIIWARIEDGSLIEVSGYYTDECNVPLYTQECTCKARRVHEDHASW